MLNVATISVDWIYFASPGEAQRVGAEVSSHGWFQYAHSTAQKAIVLPQTSEDMD